MTDPSPSSQPATWQIRLAAASRPVLLQLQAMPRVLLVVLVVALLATGLAVPGFAGGLALLVLGLFLVWLGLLAWPVLTPGGRVVRMSVALLLVAYSLAKLVGLT